MLQMDSVHQLLQVLELSGRSHRRGHPIGSAYQDAIRDVSSRHHVRYQTIGDLCRRRLGLTDMNEFVLLLTRWLAGDPIPLKQRIVQNSESAARPLVENYFNGAHSPLAPEKSPASGIEPPKPYTAPAQARESSVEHLILEEVRLRLPADLSKRLHLAHLAKLGTSREETAIALMERGFEAEKPRIRTMLESL